MKRSGKYWLDRNNVCDELHPSKSLQVSTQPRNLKSSLWKKRK